MGRHVKNDLVEPQGVNAEGSDRPGDVESGGDVSKAPDNRQGLIGYPAAKTDEELTGNPGSAEPQPQEKDGSSGQDSGLMD